MSDAGTYQEGLGPTPGAQMPADAPSRDQPAAAQPAAWSSLRDQRFDPHRKSPVLAAVLSAFPGVGQLYIGYYARGFVIAATYLLIVMMAASSREPLGPILALSAVFFWVFNIVDAGRMAALYNHAAAGLDAIEMPQDFKLPKMGGSIVGGAVLLVFGGIALSNTAFGYRLDWLEDWWPLFPVALGAYLLIRGVKDHMDQQAAPRSSYVRTATDIDDEDR